MKRYLFGNILTILLLSVLLIGCGTAASSAAAPSQEAVKSPMQEYKSVELLASAVPFNLDVPSVLPDGFKAESYATIDGKLAQIEYVNVDDTITYRQAAETTDDITGVYQKFEEEKKATIVTYEVTFSGAAGRYQKATWNSCGNSFSIYSELPLDEEVFTKTIMSMKTVNDTVKG